MHRYFLGLKELDDAIGGIDGGTNIMLIGPPMCGKGALLNSIMAAASGQTKRSYSSRRGCPAVTRC